MNVAWTRWVALGAARSYLRQQGLTPESQTADQAFHALDDLLRMDPKLIAAQWYEAATKNQEKLFISEWKQWCKKHQQKGSVQ